MLPSALTFITLLIHRIRTARAAQRDRAPEDVVRNLPWRVWTGTGWEKHEGGEDTNTVPDHVSAEIHIEEGFASKYGSPSDETSIPTETSILIPPVEDASTSLSVTPPDNQPWFESQLECAICLSEFAKGDKVRVLPCHHIFHLHEVDEWLIQRKKLVRFSSYFYQRGRSSIVNASTSSALSVRLTSLSQHHRHLFDSYPHKARVLSLLHVQLLRVQLPRKEQPYLLIALRSTINLDDINCQNFLQVSACTCYIYLLDPSSIVLPNFFLGIVKV